jgi:glycine/D-amino acid oxidase-like deaminating enzyme
MKNQHRFQIKCQNLVIAAGAWTPSVVKKLFPNASIDLKPKSDASDWILLRNPYPMRLTSIAGIFFNRVMDGNLQIVGRNDSTIWVCDSTDKSAVLPAVDEAAAPDGKAVADMLARAKLFVNGEVEVLNVGRSFRPVNESGLPVMARMPDAMLSKDAIYQDPEMQGADGVFVCWGHGRNGITLSMGSGKLMSQIIKGAETDIDVSKFGVLR